MLWHHGSLCGHRCRRRDDTGTRGGHGAVNEPDVNINSKSIDGWTPLSYGAEKGHEAMVKLLLGQPGVNPDSKDDYDRTPLLWAVEKGYE